MSTVITPIKDLNPYLNTWTVRAKVQVKAPMRTWQNPKGSGKLFSVELADETGTIKCTCFGEEAETYEPVFQQGKVYEISKGTVKPGNPKYSTNKYEMSLNKNSVVKEVSIAVSAAQLWNFVEIGQLVDIPATRLCDVLAVIRSVGQVSTIRAKKDGRDLTKRDITLVDSTNRMVILTLWDALAANFTGQEGQVIAVKSVRVSDFKDARQLSTTGSSFYELDPWVIPDAKQLADWYSENESNLAATAVSISGVAVDGGEKKDFRNEEGTLQELYDKVAGTDKTGFQTVLATIVWTKSEEKAALFYKGIPGGIAGKVIENTNRNSNPKPYYAPKTGEYYDSYEPRYIFTIAIADETARDYVTIFDEIGQQLLEIPASQVEQWRQQGAQKEIDRVFGDILGRRLIFKVRSKEEHDPTHGTQVRTIVSAAEQPNYANESKKLLEKIKLITSA